MSLIPTFWRDMDNFYADPWRLHRDLVPSWHRPRSFFDDFGFGFHPNDLNEMLRMPREFRQMEQRSRELQRRMMGEMNQFIPTTGKDGFQVCMDVQQFKPSEITVKTADNSVVIEGKHEERQDEHGHISRHFVRRYALPKGYDPNTITSELSSDGVLTIKAPPPQAIENNERVINIQHTGPASLNVKENKPIENHK